MISIINRDPAIRRQPSVSEPTEAARRRGLHLVFGDRPTTGQRVVYPLINALPDLVPQLEDLPDDELREVLLSAGLRLLGTLEDFS